MTPEVFGGGETREPYISVTNVDRYFEWGEWVRGAGAEIVFEPKDEPHGGGYRGPARKDSLAIGRFKKRCGLCHSAARRGQQTISSDENRSPTVDG